MANEIQKLKILPDFIRNSAKHFPDKVGLIYNDQHYSYKEINTITDRISTFFIKNTNKGDVIGILLPNEPDFLFIYFGILKAGCIALLFPTNISDTSLEYQIEKTNPTYIVTMSNYHTKLDRIRNDKKLHIVDVPTIQKQTTILTRKVMPSDVSTIIFTSGTTSSPKGVTLQHSNVVQATKNIIEFLKWSSNDIDINISSLSHSFGLGHVHCIFAVGGTTVLFRDAINLKKIITSISAHKATTFGAVPAILRLINEHFMTDFKKHGKNLRCIHTDTSLLEPELIHSYLRNLPHTDFSYYYGLSEASRSTFITFNQHLDKLSSVGQASPNVQIKIVDKENKNLPTGESGEICIKGRHVIKQYWKNPQASERIKNGWLHTGDIGYVDEDGFLYFQGRKDDIINVSGEKVSPEEIEMFACTFDGVKEAAAIGYPDRLLGEVVNLYIVTEEKIFNTDLLLQHLRKQLESYKIPRSIAVVESIPKTENGKLIRSKLKNTYK